MGPVQVRADVRADPIAPRMLDDREDIRVEQRLAVVVKRHDEGVILDLVENLLVLVEPEHSLPASDGLVTRRAQRAAQIADVADVDDVIVRQASQNRLLPKQLGLREQDVGDLLRRSVIDDLGHVAAVAAQLAQALANTDRVDHACPPSLPGPSLDRRRRRARRVAAWPKVAAAAASTGECLLVSVIVLPPYSSMTWPPSETAIVPVCVVLTSVTIASSDTSIFASSDERRAGHRAPNFCSKISTTLA